MYNPFSNETLENMANEIFATCNDYNSVEATEIDFKEIADSLEGTPRLDEDDFYMEIEKQLRLKGYERYDNEDFQWLKK